MAELEAASVDAFIHLGRELSSHNAPSVFTDGAIRAANDERGHARLMTSVAESLGGVVERSESPTLEIRAIEDIAVDNAIEGCVRETFGAVIASWQERLSIPGVQQVMRRIADDERNHARYAWMLYDWLCDTLPPDGQRRMQTALGDAIDNVGKSISETDARSAAILGIPPREVQHHVLRQMASWLWV